MIEKKFDPTKPVQTRDGRKARILCTDLDGSQPIVAAFTPKDPSEDERELSGTFSLDGKFFPSGIPRDTDLVNVPEKLIQEAWANVYRDHPPTFYGTRAAADTGAADYRVACVRVVVEATEGQGL